MGTINSHLIEVMYNQDPSDVLPHACVLHRSERNSWLSMKSARDIKTGIGVSQLVTQ